MKVLALYTQRTLTLLRRVLAPYGALAERGHQFSSLSVPDFSSGLGLSHDHDVTVLPNWILDRAGLDEMAAILAGTQQSKVFAYDLSDPDLLRDERVRETLSLCRLITVPNEYLRREVKLLSTGAQVMVTPSALDVSYFMSGRLSRFDIAQHVGGTVVGCFGNHDWEIVKPVLDHFHRQKQGYGPKVTFLGDEFATHTLGHLVTPVGLTLDTYPALVNYCTFGLCPYDGSRGQETAWAYEYGILYKPVIASAESPYSRELGGSGSGSGNRSAVEGRAAQFVSNGLSERWIDAIELWVKRPELRARAAREAFELANQRRAARLCEAYLKAMRQVLPQLASVV